MPQIPALVSTAEAARILRVTTRTVHRFAESGTLPPAYRLDNQRGAYLFHKSDVDDLAERRRPAA